MDSNCTDPAFAGSGLAPPTCPFASKLQDGGAHYAGVAIQLRALPELSIHLASIGAHISGRLLHCIVVWGGHRLSLINVLAHRTQRPVELQGPGFSPTPAPLPARQPVARR
jgi:hypothetical protein